MRRRMMARPTDGSFVRWALLRWRIPPPCAAADLSCNAPRSSFLLFCSSSANIPGGVIHLDSVAATLDCARRRVYDIANILEALDMVSRKSTNAYLWHGSLHMPHTIKTLRVRRVARESEGESHICRGDAARAAAASTSPAP